MNYHQGRSAGQNGSPRCFAMRSRIRTGKILVLLAILLPTVMGIAGLVFDGGLMMADYRNLQHAADAASTAAAMKLSMTENADAASSTAVDVVHSGHGLSDALVTVNIPPDSGLFAGRVGHVEVTVETPYKTRFMRILDGVIDRPMQVRSVAGTQDATTGAAIVVLDPEPANTSYPNSSDIATAIDEAGIGQDATSQSGIASLLSPVPIVGPVATSLVNNKLQDLLPDVVANLVDDVVTLVPATSLPTLTAGLEVEGLGTLKVDGAILVNNQWGGVDENGAPAGAGPGPPYGVACMPLLPLTRVFARDIRVAGGVDDEKNYLAFASEEPSPLQASRLPVQDPLEALPVPSTTRDPNNVVATVQSPPDLVRVAISATDASLLTNEVLDDLPALLKPLFQPLIAPLTALTTQAVIEPGVYNSITVLAPTGGVTFRPGVYIIRGTSPRTGLSLCVIGPIQAEGVLFYITDSLGFDPIDGSPDSNEAADEPPLNPLLSSLPSTLIAPLLSGAHISGLNDPASPFDGMLVYQRRLDRRPIVIEAQQLVGSGDISGTIYSKWGHVLFVGGNGSYNLRFAAGTFRAVTVTTTTLAPLELFPPARDVLLLE